MKQDSFEIPIAKINQTRAINWQELSPDMQAFIVAHGLKQLLNDCHAGVKRTEYKYDADWLAEVTRVVDEKHAAILSGNVSTRKARTPIDSLADRILKIAKGEIAIMARARGLKVKDLDMNKLVQQLLDKQGERITKQAKKELEAEAKMRETIKDDDELASLFDNLGEEA